MMEKTMCSDCRFGEFQLGSTIENRPGACRKNPPVPISIVTQSPLGQQQVGIQPIFPPVFPHDWCGCGDPKDGSLLMKY